MNSKESVSSKDRQIKQYKLKRIRKVLKTLNNHREKMSVLVNVRMSKIISMPISRHMYISNVHQLLNPVRGTRSWKSPWIIHFHVLLIREMATPWKSKAKSVPILRNSIAGINLGFLEEFIDCYLNSTGETKLLWA